MILDTKLVHIFKEHEKEDALLIGPYLRETLLGDFEDAESVLKRFKHAEPLEERLKDVKNGMRYLLNCQRNGRLHETIPIRIEHDFSVRKHTTCVPAYYHTHNYYEMVLVLQGICTYYVLGEQESLTMDTYTICLLAPGAVHALDAAGEEDIIVKLRIPIPLFASVSKRLGTDPAGKHGHQKPMLCYKCTEQCLQLCQMLLQAHLLEGERSEGVVQSYLVLIIKELLKEPVIGDHHETAAKVIAYIRRNPKTASLSRCAQSLGYSSGYLSRLVKGQTDETFRGLVQRTRLQRAIEMLSLTDETIEDIGRGSGYKSAAGFYKSFLKVYGMTPGEYRKMFS